MNLHSHTIRRGLPALTALSLALALAGCGANDPAPATESMSRSAASVTAAAPVGQEQYATAIQHLYVAYFGRPSEPAGMGYWNHQFELAQAPLDPAALFARYRGDARIRSVFDAFALSQESQELYPGTTAQFVDGVYRNLFNRSAELAGLAYWANAIDQGVITRSEAAMFIMLGAQGDDAVGVSKKIAVSATFYRILTERVTWILAYTGTRANEISRRMLAQVDARTDLVAFEAVIRATVEEIAGSSPVVH